MLNDFWTVLRDDEEPDNDGVAPEYAKVYSRTGESLAPPSLASGSPYKASYALFHPSGSLSSASSLSFTHFNYRELLSYTVTIYRGCATYHTLLVHVLC